jgi:hypothetical protein
LTSSVIFEAGWNFLPKIPSQTVESSIQLNASQKELVVEVELIQKNFIPTPVNHDSLSELSPIKPETLDGVMDAVSAEIRNRLVRNISAYCDCE